MLLFLAVAAILVATADALTVRHANSTQDVVSGGASAPLTFQSYYKQHTTGRGIWKWNNALDAYQRHFGGLAGEPLSVAEVGVQSGGSLQMWTTVLGKQIKMYGLDINPACKSFEEPNVIVTIGDQADWKMWEGFFVTAKGLDILVDDGGHEPIQMLTSLKASFAYIRPGGYIAIEDIAGMWYLDPMFKPAATFIGQMGQIALIESVHIYPLLMIVRKGGFAKDSPQAQQGKLVFSGPKTDVGDFTAMWTAISTVQPGSHIVLKNPQWTNLFLADSLTNFFTNFIGLHEATFKDTPTGCSTTAAPACTNAITPLSHLQSRVSGVHIFKDYAVIEVPATPQPIQATRMGTVWISYGR